MRVLRGQWRTLRQTPLTWKTLFSFNLKAIFLPFNYTPCEFKLLRWINLSFKFYLSVFVFGGLRRVNNWLHLLVVGLLSSTLLVGILAESAFAFLPNFLALVSIRIHLHLGLINHLAFGGFFSLLRFSSSFFSLSLFVLLLLFPFFLLPFAFDPVNLRTMLVPASFKVRTVV